MSSLLALGVQLNGESFETMSIIGKNETDLRLEDDVRRRVCSPISLMKARCLEIKECETPTQRNQEHGNDIHSILGFLHQHESSW